MALTRNQQERLDCLKERLKRIKECEDHDGTDGTLLEIIGGCLEDWTSEMTALDYFDARRKYIHV